LNRLSPTLSIYIGWHFLIALGAVLLIAMGLIILFDMIELLRRSVTNENIGMSLLLGMAFLKLPHTLQDALPFAVMLGMMFALYRLARNHELVVIRSAGVSVWQFLAPTLILTAVLGVLNLTIVHPFSASLYETYERLEDEIILRQESPLNISQGGLWMRENQDGLQTVVHSHYVKRENTILVMEGISIFEMKTGSRFQRRFEAETGRLQEGTFILETAWEIVPNKQSVLHRVFSLPTSITITQIQESFASPETISFWELPQFIQFSQEAGFSALPHRLYWHSLLASPFMLIAMILVASSFYLTTNNRLGGWTTRGIAGIAAGFMLYFFTRVTYALGLSATLPLPLAAWAPATVAGLLGLSYLLHREDG